MRVTVNFYHKDRGQDVQLRWFDAAGHVPASGDFVIAPNGEQWSVVARSWQQRRDGTLDCNVLVAAIPTEETDA